MKIISLSTIALLTLILSACSPHPGAGFWQSTGEENPDFIQEFARLEVGYEGRTDIFAERVNDSSEPNKAIRHCFWRGTDAQTILMTCTQASNTDIEVSYLLRIKPDQGVAELIQGGQVVGRFERQERPDVEHSYKEILQPQ